MLLDWIADVRNIGDFFIDKICLLYNWCAYLKEEINVNIKINYNMLLSTHLSWVHFCVIQYVDWSSRIICCIIITWSSTSYTISFILDSYKDNILNKTFDNKFKSTIYLLFSFQLWNISSAYKTCIDFACPCPSDNSYGICMCIDDFFWHFFWKIPVNYKSI